MKHLQNIFIVIILIFLGCGSADKIDDGSGKRDGRFETESNFYIYIYDSDTNTEDDRRCYYTIYIDKIESGRTTTGLESEEKVFEAMLTPSKHLIKVEKWVLNESLGRYVKVNNIDQPKPDYFNINIKSRDLIRVKLKSSKTGAAEYNVKVE